MNHFNKAQPVNHFNKAQHLKGPLAPNTPQISPAKGMTAKNFQPNKDISVSARSFNKDDVTTVKPDENSIISAKISAEDIDEIKIPELDPKNASTVKLSELSKDLLKQILNALDTDNKTIQQAFRRNPDFQDALSSLNAPTNILNIAVSLLAKVTGTSTISDATQAIFLLLTVSKLKNKLVEFENVLKKLENLMSQSDLDKESKKQFETRIILLENNYATIKKQITTVLVNVLRKFTPGSGMTFARAITPYNELDYRYKKDGNGIEHVEHDPSGAKVQQEDEHQYSHAETDAEARLDFIQTLNIADNQADSIQSTLNAENNEQSVSSFTELGSLHFDGVNRDVLTPDFPDELDEMAVNELLYEESGANDLHNQMNKYIQPILKKVDVENISRDELEKKLFDIGTELIKDIENVDVDVNIVSEMTDDEKATFRQKVSDIIHANKNRYDEDGNMVAAVGKTLISSTAIALSTAASLLKSKTKNSNKDINTSPKSSASDTKNSKLNNVLNTFRGVSKNAASKLKKAGKKLVQIQNTARANTFNGVSKLLHRPFVSEPLMKCLESTFPEKLTPEALKKEYEKFVNNAATMMTHDAELLLKCYAAPIVTASEIIVKLAFPLQGKDECRKFFDVEGKHMVFDASNPNHLAIALAAPGGLENFSRIDQQLQADKGINDEVRRIVAPLSKDINPSSDLISDPKKFEESLLKELQNNPELGRHVINLANEYGMPVELQQQIAKRVNVALKKNSHYQFVQPAIIQGNKSIEIVGDEEESDNNMKSTENPGVNQSESNKSTDHGTNSVAANLPPRKESMKL